MFDIQLLRCRRCNPIYKLFRERHYVADHGCVGRQMHYLIVCDAEIVGIISGGSASWAVKARDDFFGVTKETRTAMLPSIVNNCVYRIERHDKNLASRCLALWRKRIAHDWAEEYGERVIGFETYVMPNEKRTGALYKADNWTFLGLTKGRAKTISGIGNKSGRQDVERKYIFAIKCK